MSVNPKQKKLLSFVGLIFIAQTNTTPVTLNSVWPVANQTYKISNLEQTIVKNEDSLSIKVKYASGTETVKVVLTSETEKTAEIEAEPIKMTKEQIKEYVLNEVKKAGLNPREAEMIINCESRWDDKAVNNKNKNGSNDLGLWQINSIHRQQISDEGRLDYKVATQWAIEKRLRDGNWSAWVCARKLAIR